MPGSSSISLRPPAGVRRGHLRLVPAPEAAPAPGERRAGRPARRPARPRVRLTRRGRLVVSGLLVALLAGVLVALLALDARSGVAAPDGSDVRSEVVVRPGDTLWSLAVRHDPSSDPLATIEEIRRLNQLRGYTVHPGQTLQMP